MVCFPCSWMIDFLDVKIQSSSLPLCHEDILGSPASVGIPLGFAIQMLGVLHNHGSTDLEYLFKRVPCSR